MGKLDGKVAMITGGARGQGRSHAVVLAAEGADIVICDVAEQLPTVPYPMATETDLMETVRLIKDAGGRCVGVKADVRMGKQMQHVVERGLSEFGRIDILVANAAIQSYAWSWEMSDEQWNEQIAVNLTGVWQSCKAVIPQMINRGEGGSIVVTGSTGTFKGYPKLSHYVSSKQGLIGLVRSLAFELAKYSIRVNIVHPTAVNTLMINNPAMEGFFESCPEIHGAMTNLLPVGQLDPSEISKAILWLVSEDARYVTGSEYRIDAGFGIK